MPDWWCCMAAMASAKPIFWRRYRCCPAVGGSRRHRTRGPSTTREWQTAANWTISATLSRAAEGEWQIGTGCAANGGGQPRRYLHLDLHPEEGCNGPLDLHLALEVDPRVLLAFEDIVVELPEGKEPPDEFSFPLTFTWALPPLPHGPDLLRLALDLAEIGGVELPLESSAIDSFASATDAAERRITIVARQDVSLAKVLAGEELLCDTFDRALAVSQFLLERAPAWLGSE